MRCCGPSAAPAAPAVRTRLRRCGRCCCASAPPPPPRSRGRTAKNPADWGRDYDAIRDSLQQDSGASLFSFAGALNLISGNFRGGSGDGKQRRGEGLGEALIGGAYSLLYRAGGRWAEAEADAGGPYQVDPAPLVRAAERASDAERAAAAAAWRDGEDDTLAPVLACGCDSHPACLISRPRDSLICAAFATRSR
jgi:hypothetical protein